MLKNIKMECAFLRAGNNELFEPTKKSVYCSMHNFLIKNSQVKPCLRCGKGTCSKLQICNRCGASNIRQKQGYHSVAKQYNNECRKLRSIDY